MFTNNGEAVKPIPEVTMPRKKGQVHKRDEYDAIVDYHMELAKKPVKVAGHTMHPVEYEAFGLYCMGTKNKGIASALNIEPNTLAGWKRTSWWAALEDEYIVRKQKEFHVNLSKRTEDIEDAYFDIVTGVDKTDRTASARVNAIKMFAEMGKNPLIDKSTRTDINSINITADNVTVESADLSKLSAAEMLEMARTGVVPDKVVKEVN